MLSIEKVCVYKPTSSYQLSHDHARFGFNSIEMKVLKTIYGLSEVPVEKDKSIVEFVKAPVVKLLSEHVVDVHDVKLLIHCHTASVITRCGVSVVSEIKQQLDLSQSLSFGMTLHNCASVLIALELIEKLLSAYDDKAKAILVCGEKAFTPSTQVIPNTTVVGDVSVAALLSLQHKQACLVVLESIVDGRFSRGIWMTKQESLHFEQSYTENLMQVMSNAIDMAGLRLKDIKLVLPHNINSISWHRLASSLNISIDTIYLKNICKYAHCFGADVLINFSSVLDEEYLNIGDYFMMVTVGLGASFTAAIFKY